MSSPSSFPDLRRYDVILFKYSLIVFLIIFPVLVGISNPNLSSIASKHKDLEIKYYSLNQIFPDIDTRYDHTSRPKGIKNLKAGINLFTTIHFKQNILGMVRNTHYICPVNPGYISQNNFKAKVLFLDMPPPYLIS